ncbi:DUF6790 family protein [Nakamurella sp.]|uniref:DUF6790 family protein n=1 Tax=Nakamurella sp. TaxID=1869182 RepID=UPI003B3AB6AB
MITQILTALIANYLTTTFVIGLLVALIRIGRRRGHRTTEFVSGALLNSFVVWAIGVGQTVNFVMHAFFGDYAAKTIGWAQSPFQLELALSSLGFGVMAFILGRRAAPLVGKVAIVIGTAVFGFGAAGGHVFQLVVNHDVAVNNGGLLLISDIVINTVGLLLVIWHAAAARRSPGSTDAVRAMTGRPARV